MPIVAQHNNVLIHSATGSGKTLAYLLPLLSRLEPAKSLQLIVLVPNRELALQVTDLAQRLVSSRLSSSGPTTLACVDAALDIHLIAGGIAPPSGESGILHHHRELLRRIQARKAQVVISTPKQLLQLLSLGGEGAGGGSAGNLLLLDIVKGLDALVLDEVDALLPKPIMDGADYYKRKMYSKTTRAERKQMLERGSDCAVILRRLCRAAKALGKKQVSELYKRGLGHHRARRWSRQAEMLERQAGLGFQIVACSATLNSAVPGIIRRLLNLSDTPQVVSAKHVELAPDNTREYRGKAVERGAGGVAMPRTMSHLSVEVANEEMKPAALKSLLSSLSPRVSLVVLPHDAPIKQWISQLHAAGIHRAVSLHEAMGFSIRNNLSPSSLHVLEQYRKLKGLAGDAGGVNSYVFVTTERAARGLDLPHVDTVIMLYAPATSDTYVHLAGRCGRGAAVAQGGSVVSILTKDQSRRLGLFSSQLGAPIQRVES